MEDKLAALTSELREALGEGAVREGAPMSEYTTFKVGGPVELLVEPASAEEARAAIAAVRKHGVPLHVIGCGSNLLVADAGLDGVCMRLSSRFAKIDIDGTSGTAVCQAGATNEAVAKAAQAAGLAGYEFASGIPGSIGGAAYMNAGAYDGMFSDVATSVRCLTPQGELVEVSAAQAQWGYRESLMMERGYIVLEATLQLHADDAAAIQERMDDLRCRREEKQPLEMPSAGSTFKRPEGYYAGKLIQDAGLQGTRVGGAEVSTKHAGFVVNAHGATAADVRALIAQVSDVVFAKDGVRLEPEVRMWGFDD